MWWVPLPSAMGTGRHKGRAVEAAIFKQFLSVPHLGTNHPMAAVIGHDCQVSALLVAGSGEAAAFNGFSPGIGNRR